jgi:hypothetical protein
VLLVTAYADIREAVGAMRDGAVNYLTKPIDLDELLLSVRQATGLAPQPAARFGEQPLPGFHLWYAVRGFFENGGLVCYVVRASNGINGSATLNDRAGNPAVVARAVNLAIQPTPSR